MLFEECLSVQYSLSRLPEEPTRRFIGDGQSVMQAFSKMVKRVFSVYFLLGENSSVVLFSLPLKR